jgi:hypothetical protein
MLGSGPLGEQDMIETRCWMTRAAWAALWLVVACDDAQPVDGTPGELRSVAFTYQRSCFFGCPLGQPLLSGTREKIAVSDVGDVPGLRAKSSDSSVAVFAVERACHCQRDDDHGGRIEIADDAACESPFHKQCDNSVLVEAKRMGDATLELRDAHDALLDRVSVLVRDAERAQLFATYPERLGEQRVDALALATGGAVDVSVELYDERGRKLLAPEGVRWRSADAELASVGAFLIAQAAEIEAGLDVVVRGEKAGTTRLLVEVPGLEHTADVTVE